MPILGIGRGRRIRLRRVVAQHLERLQQRYPCADRRTTGEQHVTAIVSVTGFRSIARYWARSSIRDQAVVRLHVRGDASRQRTTIKGLGTFRRDRAKRRRVITIEERSPALGTRPFGQVDPRRSAVLLKGSAGPSAMLDGNVWSSIYPCSACATAGAISSAHETRPLP